MTNKKLKLGGQVLYIDQKPAANVKVFIYDEDPFYGTRNDDKIVTVTTDSKGKWKKLSKNYYDYVADVANLQITVKRGNKNLVTRRAFAPLGAWKSIPVILPMKSPRPKDSVEKSERHLVHLIDLASSYEGKKDQTLYEMIEVGANLTTQLGAAPYYGKVTMLEGSQATLPKLKAALNAAAADKSTRAVDLFMSPHGLYATNADSGKYGAISFHGDDNVVAMTKVLAELKKISPARRKKFRIVYSTACYGKDHLPAWIQAGFKAASGSKGIYTDSFNSQPAFLTHWCSLKKTFRQSVDAANASDPTDFWDKATATRSFKSEKKHKGDANLAAVWADIAKKVDSTRVVKGRGSLTIEKR